LRSSPPAEITPDLLWRRSLLFKPEPDGTVWAKLIVQISDEIRCFVGEGFLVAGR